MKPINFFLFTLLTIIALPAQETQSEISHYVFSEFTPGEVLMKNGVKNAVSLNYNALSEEMIFESNGEKLAIADNQIKEIDTVFINDRAFVLRENIFLELIDRSQVNLYVEYKCRMKYPGKVNGPGGRTSQTSSSETYMPTDFRRVIYEVVLPNGYTTSPYRYYWIEKDGTLVKFKNFNQLTKLHPTKKKPLKAYIKEHDLEYDNQEDIIQLIQHLETL